MMKKVRKEEAFLQTLSTGISAQKGYENGYMQQLQGILKISTLSNNIFVVLQRQKIMRHIR